VFWFPSTIDYCIASELESGCQVEEIKNSRLNGTWHGIRKIVADDGITALWRGLSLMLAMAIPSNIVYFIAYETMRDNSPIRNSEVLNPLVCGGLARAFASTATSPLELIKTRMQSSQGSDGVKVVTAGIKDMIKREGPSSLFRGLVLTLWRDVPFSSVYWLGVEMVRPRLHDMPYFKERDDAFLPSFISGFSAGAFAAVVTTPFDVGKTRQQVGHHASKCYNMPMLPFMASILKNEGLPALFVGTVPRVLKVAPACAIMISSYEVGKRIFHDANRNQEVILENPQNLE
jgi:solute carrier family 25 protein 39/40